MKKLLKETDSKTLKNQTKEFFNEKNQKIKDFDILENELSKIDSDVLQTLILEMTEKAKKEKIVKGQKGKSSIYKIEVDTKLRRKIRNERNNLIMEILNNSKNPKIQIENFDKFYKETYILNDYSLQSISSENSDKNTKEFLKLGLEIIKRFKSKK